jgi:hypothetical protein
MRISARQRLKSLNCAMALTAFFAGERALFRRYLFQKIDQSMPIVAETELIANRRGSRLESRARISDGSARRFFVVRRKDLRSGIRALPCLQMIEWE